MFFNNNEQHVNCWTIKHCRKLTLYFNYNLVNTSKQENFKSDRKNLNLYYFHVKWLLTPCGCWIHQEISIDSVQASSGRYMYTHNATIQIQHGYAGADPEEFLEPPYWAAIFNLHGEFWPKSWKLSGNYPNSAHNEPSFWKSCIRPWVWRNVKLSIYLRKDWKIVDKFFIYIFRS